jgi:TerC family integral membrane protein
METIAPLWLWLTFIAIVLSSLFIDFVVLKKQGAHDIGVKEALVWSLVWVGLSFIFNGLFWWAVRDSTGSVDIANTKALEFLTGYLIEKSLAVDNIFVFLMIFTYFAVPPNFQKRVLMIGIVGAIVLRTAMILAGGWLLNEFHWVLYVFGAFLILTGVKMWWAAGKEPDLNNNPVDGDLSHCTDRHHLCGRFNSSDFCHHERSIYCAYEQCVCHTGASSDVFFSGCRGRQIPLAFVWLGSHPYLHWRKDDLDRFLQNSSGRLPRRCRWYFDGDRNS